MLSTFLFCFVAGGVLIALSLNDDGGLDSDGTGGNLTILLSTPFWSFGLCSFGLCGLLLTLFPIGVAWLPVLVVSAGMGLVMGFAAARLLRILGQREANSLIRTDDLIGLEGLVTLELGEQQRGLIELQAKCTLVRRPALSDHGTLPSGTAVVVVASQGHTLTVQRI